MSGERAKISRGGTGPSESAEPLQEIFSQAAVGIAQISLDGVCLLVNDRYCQMLGYSEDELRGKTVQDFTHPDDWDAIIAIRRRQLAGEISSYTVEKRYIRKDGTIFWGRLHRSLARGRDHRPKYFIVVLEDVTETIQAEHALRDSEQRLALALSAAHLAVWDRDLSTNVITFSGEYSSIYGLANDRRALTYEGWLGLIHPEDRAHVRERTRETLTRTHVWDEEFRVVWPDGSVHWLLGKGRVFRDEAGQPVRIAGVNIETTNRKDMEEALRQSEERFRLAVQATNDAVWDIDLLAGTVSWNETYATLYGRPPETSNSWQWWIDRIHPEDREFTSGGLRSAIRSRESIWTSEYRFQRVDGTWAHIYDRAYIARDASGRAWRVIGVMQDLTQRKRAEAALRESEERFRSIADSAPVMIWISGPDLLCTFFNKGWLTFTGRSMEQELGNGWAEGVHPDDFDRCLDIYTTSFALRRNFEMEYRLRRADGEFRWILDRGAPRFAENGVFAGYIGSCVDITDLKHREQEQLSRQKLESLGVIASCVAHDLNNLMSGIIAQSDFALQDLPMQSARETLESIKSIARHGSGIVHDLMLYAETGEIDVQPLNVSQVVADMLDLLKASIPRYAKLNIALDNRLPQVLANPSHIRQLVVNLVLNASEAIDQKGGLINVTTSSVSIGPESARADATRLFEGEHVRLEVSDTGCGMSDEVVAKIFDPTFTTKGEGRGSGLAVCKSIANAYQAVINVQSAPGKGTTVEIFIPRAVKMS